MNIKIAINLAADSNYMNDIGTTVCNMLNLDPSLTVVELQQLLGERTWESTRLAGALGEQVKSELEDLAVVENLWWGVDPYSFPRIKMMMKGQDGEIRARWQGFYNWVTATERKTT